MTAKQKIARGKRAQSKGQKRPFTQEQVQLIRMSLTARLTYPGSRGSAQQLALLETAISTCLRASDLLALTVDDVAGPVMALRPDTVAVKQQKTKRVVSTRLGAKAVQALHRWITEANLGPRDRLFKFTRQYYGRIVKDWARLAHVEPRHYSTHSMRRTQPAHLYKRTNNVKAAAELLGHTNVAHTGAYLGLSTEDAHKLATEHEV